MSNFLLQAHSGWRYLVLLVLIVAIVKYLLGWLTAGRWSGFDAGLNRFAPIFIDIQWLLGLITYVMLRSWTNADPAVSQWHPLVGTLGVVAGHLAAIWTRRGATDADRFRKGFISWLIVTLALAVGIFFVLGGWNLFGSRQ